MSETTTTDARTDAEAVLELDSLRKEFEGVTALDGASLEVRRGEIVGLVGPNGAGKTTLFNCVMGALELTSGQVTLDGQDITSTPTHDIVGRGLSRTFQIPRVFPELTVRENMIAHQPHDDEGMLRTVYRETDNETTARIDELLSFVGIEEMAEEPAGDLSTGQQKLLNIAATLLPDPEVVLLDEPAAGVNPGLVDDITDLLLDLNDQGRTFLLIEHEMDVIRKVSDHVYVLANGTNLTDADPDTALSDPEVLEAYFGE